MVKLSTSLVVQKLSRTAIRRKLPEEPETAIKKQENSYLLKKLTHLHLQGNFISEIGDISDCRNLSVLFLQNNCLTHLTNLHHSVNLTHLYLQHNKITKLENLQPLTKLRKLYLGQNCIAVVEGLEQLKQLEELHVEKQELPAGESLYFDPRTVRSLANCMKVLNISGNNLTTLSELSSLKELVRCIARDNRLTDLLDLATTVSHWRCLVTAEFTGNAVCAEQKYRTKVIAGASFTLRNLDGKQVTDITRLCMKKMEKHKAVMNLKPIQEEHDGHSSDIHFSINFNAPNMAYLRQLTPGMLYEFRNKTVAMVCTGKVPIVATAGLRVTSVSHGPVPQLPTDVTGYQAWQAFNPHSNKGVLPLAFERQKHKQETMSLIPFTDHLPTL